MRLGKRAQSFLLLTLIFSLATEKSMAGAFDVEDLKYTPTPGYKVFSKTIYADQKPQPQLGACKVDYSLAIGTSSQDKLFKIFDNLTCSSMGMSVSSEKLNFNYCSTACGCKNFETPDVTKLLDQDDGKKREFLENEAMLYLIRENINAEMEKYTSDKADIFKRLLKYVDNMPPELKSQISTCERPALPHTGECLPNSNWDSAAKFNITYFQANGVSNKAGSYKKHVDNVIGKEESERSSGDVVRANILFNQMQMVAEDKSLSGKFSDFVLADNFYDSKYYNDIKNVKDPITEYISSAVRSEGNGDDKRIVDISKLSPEELKRKVILAIVESTSSSYVSMKGEDPILRFRNNLSRTESDVKKALDGVQFTSADFDADSKTSVLTGLSKKLNAVRVNLANKYIKESCGQLPTTIGQVCSTLSNRIGNGQIVDAFNLNKGNLLENILAYYKKSTAPDKDEKIKKLTEMIKAKDQTYQNYMAYMMEKNSCQEKFKELPCATKSEAAKHAAKQKIDKEMEAAYQSDHQQKKRELEAILSQNDSLQRDFKQAGFKMSDFKVDSNRDTLAINGVLSASKGNVDTVISRSDDYSSLTKGLQDQAAATTVHPQQNVRVDPVNTDMINSVPENNKTAERSFGDDDINAQLRSRLAQLERKEKSLSKKVTDSSNDSETSGNSDELQSLRQQIEELKNLQAKNTKEKAEAIARMDASKEASSTTSSGENGRSTIVTNSSGNSTNSNRNDDESAAVAHNAIAASASADYAASSSGNSASHAAASSNGGPGAGKGTSEKSGNGIVLTKSGDVLIDPASIMDNPNDGDIANTLELGKGQPFLIRENGVLMKVTAELDSKGKPKMSHGKIVYKKTKLTKEQQRSVAQEAINTQKAVKEVSNEPVRLYNLKSLLNDKVKAAQ